MASFAIALSNVEAPRARFAIALSIEEASMASFAIAVAYFGRLKSVVSCK
jgi:hypothetical protein